jgi:hypothetical protein
MTICGPQWRTAKAMVWARDNYGTTRIGDGPSKSSSHTVVRVSTSTGGDGDLIGPVRADGDEQLWRQIKLIIIIFN